jgi:hypothetical protein
METQEPKVNPAAPQHPQHRGPKTGGSDSGRLMGGLVIVTVGVLLLAYKMGAGIPGWIFSWPMLLIGLGIYVGARHNFRDFGWIIPVAIGALFLVDRMYINIDLYRYFWPIVVIGLGLYLIFKSRRRTRGFDESRWGSDAPVSEHEDVIDCVTIFGGVKKNIISKDFRGGEAVTIFGGTELNLMQADSSQYMVLELVQVFGGTKLIVPPHWKIHAEEMVTIFGGLNDKRSMSAQTATPEETRVLVLKGTVLFGGIDLKNF